jgi:hypothetical protein
MREKLKECYLLHYKRHRKLGAVAQVCNPSFLGGRNWEDRDLRSAQAKNSRDPHLNQCLGEAAHPCHFSYARKHREEDHSPG